MRSRDLICLLAASASLIQVPRIRAQDLPTDGAVRSPADPRIDKSIHRALELLKTSQHADGSWDSGHFGKATSITSLCVLAYLACGHIPGETGPFGTTIERGIRFVLAHQRPNGLIVANTLNGPMYCHGISTLMLAEVTGMATDAKLSSDCREALSRAVALILQAQNRKKDENHSGGWRYQPDSPDSDLSVTGWQVIALRAAKSAGVAIPAENIDRAVAYVRKCAFKDGGFGYQPGGGPNNPRTGTGVLALEICGEHELPEAVAGAEYLVKHPPKWSSDYFFYEVYYAPQALFQVGDKYFQDYYPKLVKLLLEHQERDGSWLSGNGNDRAGGRNYCTAMAVLALAVEYRYLPIYQR